jgi:hypothetical protein
MIEQFENLTIPVEVPLTDWLKQTPMDEHETGFGAHR